MKVMNALGLTVLALLLGPTSASAQVDQSSLIQEAARTGQVLPAGELWFRAPLTLTDVIGLRGSPDGLTVLRPLPGPVQPKAALTIKTTFPGDEALGLPRRRTFADFRIQCNGPDALEYGILLDAAVVRVERVDIIDCHLGVAIKAAVDVAFRDGIFRRNACHVYIPGSGPNTVTTVRFSGMQLREASGVAVLIQNGLGITFNDWTIFESNAWAGLVVQPTPGNVVRHVHLNDAWFENNPAHLVDPFGLVRTGHVWFEQGSRQR